MPTPTYTPLANITLGSAAASVTFSSISQAYRDLVLVVNGGVSASSSDLIRIRINNDSGSNYSDVYMAGDSGGTSSGTNATTSVVLGRLFTGSNSVLIQIMDYSATDKHKSGLSRLNSNSQDATQAVAFRYASTSAITTISVLFPIYLFAAGSTFALYGIAA